MSESRWEEDYNAILADRDALKLRVASLEAALRNEVNQLRYMRPDGCKCEACSRGADLDAALSGSPSALREIVVEAAYRGADSDDPKARATAEDIAEAIATARAEGRREALEEAASYLAQDGSIGRELAARIRTLAETQEEA